MAEIDWNVSEMRKSLLLYHHGSSCVLFRSLQQISFLWATQPEYSLSFYLRSACYASLGNILNIGACASFRKLRIIFVVNGSYSKEIRNNGVSEGVIYDGDGTTNHQVL